MAVTSGFFNSLNGDRRYSAEQFSSILDNLITDGVFSNVGTAFAVTSDTGNNVIVGVGRCWFNSTWVYNDVILPLALSDPEVLLNRIDAVIIEINKNEAVRAGTIKVLEGAPLSNPARPTLTKDNNIFQYPLAYIYRKAGATSITQADITNMIGTSACPFVTGILAVQNIDNIVAQWEAEFDVWFDTLEETLSGDVAANLAGQILDLYSKFDDLAEEKAVYTDISDSSEDIIEDNNGNKIQGRTVLTESGTVGESGGSGGGGTTEGEIDPYKIGDILTTVRTDLGSKWLLCNGDPIEEVYFPELYERLPALPENQYEQVTLPDIGSETIQQFKCLNNFYVLLTNKSLYYTTELGSSWTKSSVEPQNNNAFESIEYGNGYWVIIDSGSGQGTDIWYSTGLSETFTLRDIYSANYYNCSELAFGNGVFCFLIEALTGYLYAVRFSDPSGSMSSSIIVISGKNYISYPSLGFDDGYFAFSAGGTSGSSVVDYESYAGFSETGDKGTWDYFLMHSSPFSDVRILGASVVVDGHFYASDKVQTSAQAGYEPNLYGRAITASGSLESVGCPAKYDGIITKAGDYVIAKTTDNNVLMYTKDPSNINYWSNFSVPVASVEGVTYDGESFFVYDDEFVYKSVKSLPTISVSGAYAYIKGK